MLEIQCSFLHWAPGYILLPMYASKVSAGFPSPAEEWQEDILSLDDRLIKHPAATFLLRVTGNSMINAGIGNGAILVVDKSIEAKPKDIVIAAVNGDFTVKRLIKQNGKLLLKPENSDYSVIELTDDSQVFGVVTAAINQFSRRQ